MPKVWIIHDAFLHIVDVARNIIRDFHVFRTNIKFVSLLDRYLSRRRQNLISASLLPVARLDAPRF